MQTIDPNDLTNQQHIDELLEKSRALKERSKAINESLNTLKENANKMKHYNTSHHLIKKEEEQSDSK